MRPARCYCRLTLLTRSTGRRRLRHGQRVRDSRGTRVDGGRRRRGLRKRREAAGGPRRRGAQAPPPVSPSRASYARLSAAQLSRQLAVEHDARERLEDFLREKGISVDHLGLGTTGVSSELLRTVRKTLTTQLPANASLQDVRSALALAESRLAEAEEGHSASMMAVDSLMHVINIVSAMDNSTEASVMQALPTMASLAAKGAAARALLAAGAAASVAETMLAHRVRRPCCVARRCAGNSHVLRTGQRGAALRGVHRPVRAGRRPAQPPGPVGRRCRARAHHPGGHVRPRRFARRRGAHQDGLRARQRPVGRPGGGTRARRCRPRHGGCPPAAGLWRCAAACARACPLRRRLVGVRGCAHERACDGCARRHVPAERRQRRPERRPRGVAAGGAGQHRACARNGHGVSSHGGLAGGTGDCKVRCRGVHHAATARCSDPCRLCRSKTGGGSFFSCIGGRDALPPQAESLWLQAVRDASARRKQPAQSQVGSFVSQSGPTAVTGTASTAVTATTQSTAPPRQAASKPRAPPPAARPPPPQRVYTAPPAPSPLPPAAPRQASRQAAPPSQARQGEPDFDDSQVYGQL